MKLDVIEEMKLKWPDGCDRTRIQDRRSQAAWKFGTAKYRDGLVAELGRMGATSVLICRSENERLDPVERYRGCSASGAPEDSSN